MKSGLENPIDRGVQSELGRSLSGYRRRLNPYVFSSFSVMPRLGGASSMPRLLKLPPKRRGILDRPPSRTMTARRRLFRPNLLTPRMTAPNAPPAPAPNPARPRLLARGPCGLSEAARADRAVARLFVRPATGAVGIDASDLDARIRRRPRHHRAVCAGRHALHAEVSLGAAGRRAARTVFHARVRPPPRLAVARNCC